MPLVQNNAADMSPPERHRASALGLPRVIRISGFLVATLIAIAALYQFFVQIDCRDADSYALCRGLRSVIGRALAVFAGFCVLAVSRPGVFRTFAAQAEVTDKGTRWAIVAFLAGLTSLLMPAIVLHDITAPGSFGRAVTFWLAGGLTIIPAALRWLAPWGVWTTLTGSLGWLSIPVFGVLLLTPELARMVQPLWDISVLTLLTFALVYRLLALVGTGAFARPEDLIVGVEDFAVHIAAQCSGVEGFMLVTAFLLLYGVLFHSTIRPWRFVLVVLPLALFISWIMNIVRIATLVLIGANVSPALAVDGFHSYAGWLFFTLLAMMILGLVHSVPWFHRSESIAPAFMRLRDDPAAAHLLPFAVFMLSGIVAFAFFTQPAMGYPLRVLMMTAVLLPFAPQYTTFVWRADPVAIAIGAGVGLLWIVMQGGPEAAPSGIGQMLADLSIIAAGLWIALRLLGTIVLVPLIEELFFRGYLLARIDTGGKVLRMVAIAVSTLAFALMHGRWIEATIAGLAFALVYLRSNRIADAVVAHMVANAVVAAAALASGRWSLI